MEGHSPNKISSAEAILVGALSSGCNVRNSVMFVIFGLMFNLIFSFLDYVIFVIFTPSLNHTN